MREDVSLRNDAPHPVTCAVVLTADADFADLFEVKEGRVHPRHDVRTRIGDSHLHIVWRGGGHEHGVFVRSSQEAEAITGGLRWQVTVPPRGEWAPASRPSHLSMAGHCRCAILAASRSSTPSPPAGSASGGAAPRRCGRRSRLRRRAARSVKDIGALRIFDPEHPERAVVAAGAPWFMALFGARLAADLVDGACRWTTASPLGTLQTLADRQGRVDRPGLRGGARAGSCTRSASARPPHSRSAAAASTTEPPTPPPCSSCCSVNCAGGAAMTRQARALLPHADRALEWVERYGDADGDGFIEYARKTERRPGQPGLEGLMGRHQLRRRPDRPTADRPRRSPGIHLRRLPGARRLRPGSRRRDRRPALAGKAAPAEGRDFNQAFWLPEHGLVRRRDSTGTSGRSTRSPPTSGIACGPASPMQDKAAAVADHLLSDEMFSGWGIRTLATSMAAYNPMSYHNGSVWPHDNAHLRQRPDALRLRRSTPSRSPGDLRRRHPFRPPPARVVLRILRAREFPAPVPYPTSCSPQAWAAAAPLELLRGLLRLDPPAAGSPPLVRASDPRPLPAVAPDNLRLGDMELAIDIRGDGWELDRTRRQRHRPRTLTAAPDAMTTPEGQCVSGGFAWYGSLLAQVRSEEGRR